MNVNEIDLINQQKWVHITGVTDTDFKDYFNKYKVPELIQEKMLAEKTQPRLIQYESGIFLNLRALNTNRNENPDDMVSVRIWVTSYGMLSLSPKPLSSVRELLAGPVPTSAYNCFVQLTKRIHDKIFNYVYDLQSKMDDIEEVVIDFETTIDQSEISKFKLSCLEIHKFSAFQEEVLEECVAYFEGKSIDSMTVLKDALFTIQKTNRNLNALRDRSRVVSDELSRQAAEHVSKVSFLLTIIAALFMPISVVSGLMGMNVPGLPLADHPNGFWIVLSFSGVISLIALGIYSKKFRRK